MRTRDEGQNSTSSELASLEETMQQEAEHKAAYAGAPFCAPTLSLQLIADSLQTHLTAIHSTPHMHISVSAESILWYALP